METILEPGTEQDDEEEEEPEEEEEEESTESFGEMINSFGSTGKAKRRSKRSWRRTEVFCTSNDLYSSSLLRIVILDSLALARLAEVPFLELDFLVGFSFVVDDVLFSVCPWPGCV